MISEAVTAAFDQNDFQTPWGKLDGIFTIALAVMGRFGAPARRDARPASFGRRSRASDPFPVPISVNSARTSNPSASSCLPLGRVNRLDSQLFPFASSMPVRL